MSGQFQNPHFNGCNPGFKLKHLPPYMLKNIFWFNFPKRLLVHSGQRISHHRPKGRGIQHEVVVDLVAANCEEFDS
jgi:hypothetical protein